MDVNVGLSWIENKKKRGINIQSTFEGDWDNREDHNLFRNKIHELYPSKMIIGYCPTDKEALTK